MSGLFDRLGAGFLGFVLLLPGMARADEAAMPSRFIEPPILAEAVQAGELPPVGERLPTVPAVATCGGPDQAIGLHGGEMVMLMSSPKDTRMMVVYGYARLVAYDRDLALQPDLLESLETEGGRSFTLHLRPGHKWSDGQPFTTEDFRYFWEDVANSPDLSPSGPPVELLMDGEAPKVEIIDETTVRYSWSKPNPYFLPALAGPSPLYIYRPSHYLKTYHAKHADPAALQDKLEETGQPGWAALHNRMDNMYRNDNRDLPTLEPWVLATKPPSERFIFKRNPYYHRVDPEGRQLPYLDSVAFQIADTKLIPAKVAAGESDLTARYLRLDNFTILKESEKRSNYRVRLWDSSLGSQVTIYPNLNANDPAWRALLRDVRFRRALSLGIDRAELNQTFYKGLASEGANSVLPQSPLYDEAYQSAWADFDLDQANALLDEIGLTERAGSDLRLLPDGRPLEIVIYMTGQSPEEEDVLLLIHDSWRQLGVKLIVKPIDRDGMRNNVFSGDALMSVWTGLENGLPTADMAPLEVAPTSQQQLQWPKWGQFIETKGVDGEPVDLPEAQRLAELLKAWTEADDVAAREGYWREMLQIYTDQVFTIGTVAGVPQPVAVSNRLHNVPEEGIYSWNPGAHFGIYRPDCFWKDGPGPGTN